MRGWSVGASALVIVVLLTAGSAGAASVSIRSSEVRYGGPNPFGFNLELVYRADPGERNRTVIRATPGIPASVTDPGAVIIAGDHCSSVDAHSVSCVPPPGAGAPPFVLAGAIRGADVQLGDLDGELELIEGGTGAQVMLFAGGGPGDDRLSNLWATGGGVLDGGGGRDELHGGSGNDVLIDGDVDGGAGDAAPGPDLMDGGGGVDTLSYRQRTAPVSVDLASPRRAGERGERDTLRYVESIVGGQGGDRLAGDDGPNEIDGQRGRNTLIGRGEDDSLRNGHGPVSCGTGTDYVFKPGATDFFAPSCETILASGRLPYPVYPTRVRPAFVRYPLRCPRDDDDPSVLCACSATMSITQASRPHRRLGTGRLPLARRESRHLDVRLTTLGRRLATRRHGVAATVRLATDGYPTMRWTIRLRVPRS